MSLEENQEVRPTSRSHLAALVKRGQAAARAAEAKGDAGSQPKDKPSRTSELLLGKKKSSRPSAAAEREMIRANRAGSNYDPTDRTESYGAAEVSPSVEADRYRATADRKMERTNKDNTPKNRIASKRAMDRYSEFFNKNRRAIGDSYDATAEFTDRVMNRVTEAFAEMTPAERKDYDSKALKPKNVRSSSRSEREKYVRDFRANRRGEGSGRLGVKGQKRNDLKRRLGGKNPEADVARWIKNADGSGQWSDGYRGLDKPV